MSQKQYDDTNTGIIGNNDYKQQDKHPDQRGRANVAGIWYWVSGWNKGANGREFTSLAFTEMTQAEVDTMMSKRAEKNQPQQRPQQRQQQQPAQSQPQQSQQAQTPPGHAHSSNNPPMDFDDDIPF